MTEEQILGCFGNWVELSGGTLRVEVQDILARDDFAIVVSRDTAQRDGRSLEQRSLHYWEMPGGQIPSTDEHCIA